MSAKRPAAFASDNNAPVHPEVLAAIARANVGHAVAYGGDDWTARAEKLLARELGSGARAFLTLNGTGANVVSVFAALAPHEAVLCSQHAHMHTDECGAPERVAGAKLIACPAPDGKLTAPILERRLVGLGSEHHVQPRMVSITQSTELGTVYSLEELRALSRFCRKHELLLHCDGARLSNAAAALGVPLRALAKDAGLDALSFGLTKNGAMNAEAVVVWNGALAKRLPFARKQAGQLGSKLRYAAAQFAALLEDGLWRRNAERANAAARLLAQETVKSGISLAHPAQANAVFALLPKPVIEPLRKKFRFYDWDERLGLVRWMCSWDTTREDVLAFAAALRSELSKAKRKARAVATARA